MKGWEYEELTEVMTENYQQFISKGRGKEYAIVRLANEFVNMGQIEDVIVDVVVGEIMIEQQKPLTEYICGISQRLEQFNISSAIDELLEKEREDFKHWINKVLNGFKMFML